MDEWAGARLMDEQVKLNTQNIMDLTSDMGATAHEMQKLNTFWVEKYNQLQETVKNMAHAMQVAIGVRNTKIAECNTNIRHLKEKVDSLTGVCYTLSDKITTLEQQLKKLTEQVDLNSQTLEALQ